VIPFGCGDFVAGYLSMQVKGKLTPAIQNTFYRITARGNGDVEIHVLPEVSVVGSGPRVSAFRGLGCFCDTEK
jgi:hypothetical protein